MSSSDGSTLVCTNQLLPDTAFNQSGHSSLSKRKRASDDGGQLVRKSRDNDCKALEAALANLGKSLNVQEHLEKGEKGIMIAAYLSSVLKTLRQIEYNHSSTVDTNLQPNDLIHQLKQTRCIKLNTAFPQRYVSLLSQQQSRVVGAQVGHWRVSLNTIIVNTQHPYISQGCSVLLAQPLHNSGGFHIAALFSRTDDMNHISNAHPVVLVYEETRSLCRGIAFNASYADYERETQCPCCLKFWGETMKRGFRMSGANRAVKRPFTRRRRPS